MSRRTAVVAAGGTGGHLFPAEALSRELIARGWSVVLATDARGAAYAQSFPAEERLALDAATFRLSAPFSVLRGGRQILQGLAQARAAYRRLDPAVVVGFGGYPSLPALIAAMSQGRPTVLHEQNAVLGRVNRLLSGRATAVASAFPTLGKASASVAKRSQPVGNPVRAEIRALHGRAYQPPTDEVRLLVTGGSQGARLLSEVVPAAIASLPAKLRARLVVAQQSRPEFADAARATYAAAGVRAEVAAFFGDMAERLSSAHLVIGRAGASTVSELAVAGLPSILIPLAIATDDHQTLNARLLTDVGAAEAIAEPELTVERLHAVLRAMLADPAALSERAAGARGVAKPDAAARLADLVETTGLTLRGSGRR